MKTKINKNLDVVQIPFNCIDQRFLSMQKKVKNKKIKYYARSIFLQGALLKKVSDDKYLSKLYVLFNKTLQKKNLDKISFCLSSVLNHQIIDKIMRNNSPALFHLHKTSLQCSCS